MGIIYFCWNSLTKQLYIGKSKRTLKQRIGEHYGKADNGSETTFHNALKKYEASVFKWDVLEYDVPEEKLDEREVFNIAKYDSHEKGYNDTRGGGSCDSKLSDEDIQKMIDMVKRGFNFTDIARFFDCSTTTIADTLKAHGLSADDIEKNRVSHSVKSVYKICPSTNKILSDYDSCADASKSTGVNVSSITKCCRGEYVRAGGFHWRFKDNINNEELEKGHVNYVPNSKNRAVAIFAVNVDTGKEHYFASVNQAQKGCVGGRHELIKEFLDSGKPYRGYILTSAA